ncbi:hypothetical protein LTR95_007457 [Oleoguttula sp. CCFEE 5521]
MWAATLPFGEGPIASVSSLRSYNAPGSSIGNDAVVFAVGKVGCRSAIHELIIKSGSDFVRLALTGGWQEAQTNLVKLPVDDLGIFAVYQRWVYYGDLRTMSHRSNAQCDIREYEVLVNAYVLGEKIMDSDFKDAVIDGIIEKLPAEASFDVQLTPLIYEGTPTKCALRWLWLDVYYHSGTAAWLDNELCHSHPDFLSEYGESKSQSRIAGAKPCAVAYMGDTCHYHEHGSRPCYRQKWSALSGSHSEVGKTFAGPGMPVVPDPILSPSGFYHACKPSQSSPTPTEYPYTSHLPSPQRPLSKPVPSTFALSGTTGHVTGGSLADGLGKNSSCRC